MDIALLFVVLILLGPALMWWSTKRKAEEVAKDRGGAKGAKKSSVSPLRGVAELSKTDRLERVEGVLDEATDGLGGEVHFEREDEVVEWRGEVDGLAVRLRLRRMRIDVSVKAGLDLGPVDLRWNRKKKHSKKRPAPWGDSDIVELFVGPGVYLHDFASDVHVMAARLHALPAEALNALVEAMPRDELAQVQARPSGDVELEFARPADQLRHLETRLRAAIEQGVVLAKAWQGVADPSDVPDEEEDDAPEVPSVPTHDCRYCKSRFFFTPEQPTCPNCGAPPDAA